MKKIYMNENSFKNIFNEELEPMSYLEKQFKDVDLSKYDGYDPKNFQIITSNEDDTEKEIDDDVNAKEIIKDKLVNAQEIIEGLIDYLTYSDYAIKKGGEIFKTHLTKATNIFNELKNFFEE